MYREDTMKDEVVADKLQVMKFLQAKHLDIRCNAMAKP